MEETGSRGERRWRRRMAAPLAALACLLALALAAASGCSLPWGSSTEAAGPAPEASGGALPAGASASLAAPAATDLSLVPAFDGESPFVELSGGEPGFTAADAGDGSSFKAYGALDELGRCTWAVACVGSDLFPEHEREDISEVRPSGWSTAEYGFIDGGRLFNRCHLIARMLTAEEANERNLVTGTRYMNVQGMEPFERQVRDYIERTGNHVLYRATPVFESDELVCRGVRLEALSVEDGGQGVRFDVFCHNVQPGVGIDYATGGSWLEEDGGQAGEQAAEDGAAGQAEAGASAVGRPAGDGPEPTYVLNTKSRKFHRPSCEGVASMSPANREDFFGTREEALEQGYEPCGTCRP